MMAGFKWNAGAKAAIAAQVQDALAGTAQDILGDLKEKGYVPHARSGEGAGMLEASGKVEATPRRVRIVYDAPFAARTYFHPKWQFSTVPNAAARGLWFKPYQERGERVPFVVESFRRRLGSARGLIE